MAMKSKAKSKAYAPRKMRDNNKPTLCFAPKWLHDLDLEASKAMKADVGPDGFSRVKLNDFLKSQCLTLSMEQLRIAKQRYAPFFAQETT